MIFEFIKIIYYYFIMSKNCIDTNSYNEIVSFLSENYEKGELAILNDNETKILKETSKNLKLVFLAKNVVFDENGFEQIIKKCSSFINNSSSGGMRRASTLPIMRTNYGNQQLALKIPEFQPPPPQPVKNKQNNGFNRYDFLSILGLFVAIFVAYLSYLELNRSLIEFAEQDINELSNGLKEEVQLAISSTPREELSFISYLYNIFTTFTCNIAEQTSSTLQSSISRILTSAIPDFSSQIVSICGSKETGIFGVAESVFKAVLNPQGNQECVMRLTKTLVEQFVSERQNKLNIMLVSMQASNTTIQSYIRFAIGLGYSSCSYLVYRLKNGLKKPSKLRNEPLLAIEEGGSKINKNKKSKKHKNSKNHKKPKRNTKKNKKRTRGGGEGDWKTTPITDPIELSRLEEADRIAEERERNNKKMRELDAELERNRNNIIRGFASTPMNPKEIERQNRQDELDNKRLNSEKAKLRKLRVADLGGSKKRYKKTTTKKQKNKKRGNKFGGNNIGANCNEPNFSIYNTNLLKLFPYKGGELELDDPYKNSEGPQY